MKLKVITADAILFNDHAKSLNISERTGSFTILKDHAPLITIAKDFVSTVQTETGDLTYIAANFGTLKVLNNEVFLIIDYGVAGTDKENARMNLMNLKKEMVEKHGDLGDDVIANLEFELIKRTRELRI